MAEVIIKYTADATELKASVDQINKANDAMTANALKNAEKYSDGLKGIGNEAKNAFAGSQVSNALKENNTALERLTKTGKSLTGQLRGLKAELTLLEQQGKDNTAEFNQLLIAASRLEDQIGDTRARVRILASDTFKFDAAVGAIQGLAAGFEVAQGAAALFGNESEDLQKAILKVQGAMAIANGVSQIAGLLLDENATKTAGLTAKQVAYNFVVGQSTGLMKAFKIGLAATGVGLLVLGLVALVNNFDKVKAALENSIPGFKTVSNAIGDVVDTIKEWVGASDDAERAGAAFEKATKRQNDATKAIVDGYNRRIEVEKAAGKNTTQLEIEREKAVIEASKKILNDYKFKSTELIKLDEEQKQKAIDAAKEAQDAILESENNILVIKTAAAKEASDKAKEQSKKAAEAEKKSAEEVTKAREQLAKLEQDAFANSVDQREKILSESNTKIAELEQAFIDSKFAKGSEEETKLQNAIQAIKQDATKQIADIDQKALEDKVAKEKEAAEKIAEEQRAAAESSINTQISLVKRLEIEQGSSLERRIQLINLEADQRKLAATNSIKDEQERANEILLIETETQKAIQDERKQSADKQLEQLAEIAQATADLFGSIIELQGIQSQKRIEEINAASEAEKLAIEQSTLSEADKQRKLEALQLRTAQKVAAEKRKQAVAEKAAAIFEATIGTAVAVAKAPDPVQKAIALAAGLAQIAIIAATPIPKFKRGGMVGGRSHEAGGTLIEAERGEFVVNRNSVSRHRSELDALNTSSAAFKSLIDERYVRPALNYYMGKKERAINVNASLNSKGMEREIKGMRRDLKRNNTVININGNDSRYAWHLN